MTPDNFTIQESFLDVGDGHSLYYQDWGNPKAKRPILFIHGGPGGSAQDRHKEPYAGRKQRVIFFDQRGCGKSLPYGSLEHNTTDNLIEDINKLVKHLKLRKFVITGGSWGSCLALAYTLKHPSNVEALVLHGIFTGSRDEIDWLDKGRFKAFYPDIWDNFVKQVPKAHQHNPTQYLYKLVMDKDEAAAKQAAYTYDILEGSVMSLDDQWFKPDDFEDFDPAGMRIEMHYMQNGCFMPDKHILNNAHKLKLPVWLIQGRYDAVCPPMIAYELHKQLPNSQLIWTINGHKADHESRTVQRTILSQWS